MTGYSSDDGAIKLHTCVLEAVTSLEYVHCRLISWPVCTYRCSWSLQVHFFSVPSHTIELNP